MPEVTLQLEYQSKHCSYGRSSIHPTWKDHSVARYGVVTEQDRLYPTESQCERFALRIERLIRKESEYLDLSRVMLLIDLDNGKHYISHDMAYPGLYGSESIHEANRRFIAHEYADTGIIQAGIAYMPLTTETIELIAGLDSYPVFDDEYVSEVELEYEDQYVKEDLIREIGNLLENNPAVDSRLQNVCLFDVLAIIDGTDESDDESAYSLYDDMTDDQKVELLYQGMQELDCYPECDGSYASMRDRDQIKLAEWIADHLSPVSPPVPAGQLPLWTAA